MNTDIKHIHRDLIERSKMGDRKAQYALYEKYVDAMFNVSMRMVGNREDAEDVLQESFISAFNNLKSYRYESTFGAWIKRIVVNRSINFLKQRRLNFQDTDNIPEPQVEMVEDYEEKQQRVFQLDKIKRGIKELPDGYRQILNLYLIEGFDHNEISEFAGISVSTSKSQYHRAKKKLVEIVEQMG